MKALLLFPPQWTPNSPYLALPLLSAQLKKHGYETEIRDLNIEFFNRILTKENLTRRLGEAKELFRTLGEIVAHDYPDAVKNFDSYSVKEQTMLMKYKRIADILGSDVKLIVRETRKEFY